MAHASIRHENTTPMQALEELDRRWAHFLGEIATGVKLEAALASAQMTRQMYESLTRAEGGVYLQQYQDARTTWMRRQWPDERIEEMLMRLAGGESVEAICNSFDVIKSSWFLLVTRVPELMALYQEAMRAKALNMGEEVLEIADDSDADLERAESRGQVIIKGNMAAVKRSELKVNTRRFLMESWLPKVFGKDAARLEATINVEVNHVEQLEEARQRRDRGVKISKAERADAVEAEIVAAATAPALPSVVPTTKTIDVAKAVAWLE